MNNGLDAGDLAHIRASYASGSATQAELAEEFGVTQSAISRIVRHDRRAELPQPLTETGRMVKAFDQFLEGREIEPAKALHVELLYLLAEKLDACAASTAAASANALPALVARFAEVLHTLEFGEADLTEELARQLAWLRPGGGRHAW